MKSLPSGTAARKRASSSNKTQGCIFQQFNRIDLSRVSGELRQLRFLFDCEMNFYVHHDRGKLWVRGKQRVPFIGRRKDSSNHAFVSVVFTNPEPQKINTDFYGEGAMSQCRPCGPKFLSSSFG
jgi:hypothetical protein